MPPSGAACPAPARAFPSSTSHPLNGEDPRPLPLVERKGRLKRLLRRRANHLIAEALSIEGRGRALFAAVEEHDLEGIVAKRKDSPYKVTVQPSRHWIKVKNPSYSQLERREELFERV
jgi:ATP-dependent DNA ligase